ncbi:MULTISPECIES: GlsB/YeaQ/YmgE family stress response membrane protein [unclassified Knoellia]|uniref:GlsB/YeaQ/YmgE family stress response membrane protein n=1 Tax=unclassified Knoellia TaxID=2618719 RepID=UPI0023DC58B9|nr:MULTISPECIES: GlsB/YeaQ/YmgE family stress response membrane protein [unclassified Knoellia]MDF2093436.1 GlsB/YeaQ/YmgE family stress response membrane protein [Knoellia sp. 3-2P3]MDF2144251.1 GlsB/YeaQ/YmgE family stress response membrane protein [Knoellia sp. p5-6-4]
MEIIGVIIAGIVIGALARVVMPGRQNISALITVVLGVLGVLIGWYLAAALGVESTSGIDWIRWIISIIVAAALIAGYIAVTGRRNTHHV